MVPAPTFLKEKIGGALMKKSLIYFVPIMSIFVVSAIITTYFMENIFNLFELARINISTILINSDYKIFLLYFSVVGLINIRRNRGGNKSSSYYRHGRAKIPGRLRKDP